MVKLLSASQRHFCCRYFFKFLNFFELVLLSCRFENMRFFYVSVKATITCVLYNTYSNLLLYNSELPSLLLCLLKITGFVIWRQHFHSNFHIIAMLVAWPHFGSEFRKLKSLFLSPHTLYDLRQTSESLVLFYATYRVELQNWVSQIIYPLLSRLINWNHDCNSPFHDFR